MKAGWQIEKQEKSEVKGCEWWGEKADRIKRCGESMIKL